MSDLELKGAKYRSQETDYDLRWQEMSITFQPMKEKVQHSCLASLILGSFKVIFFLATAWPQMLKMWVSLQTPGRWFRHIQECTRTSFPLAVSLKHVFFTVANFPPCVLTGDDCKGEVDLVLWLPLLLPQASPKQRYSLPYAWRLLSVLCCSGHLLQIRHA